MGKLLIRDAANAAWLDVFCKGAFQIRNAANTAWIPMNESNTFVRNATNTGWVKPTCPVVYAAGTLLGAGYNADGNLGTGDTVDRHVLTQIGAAGVWKQVCSTQFVTMALKADGTIWQLGTVMSQIGVDTNWASISCGDSHYAAIKTDGTLWMWGINTYGQLAQPTATVGYLSAPTKVGIDTNWKQVSCGQYHTVAVKTDGTVWSWGSNSYMQLGLGLGSLQSAPAQDVRIQSPSQVALSGIVQVACGSIHSMALKSDGSLYAWGTTTSGATGLASNANTPVLKGTGYAAITCGLYLTMARLTTGRISMWGQGCQNFPFTNVDVDWVDFSTFNVGNAVSSSFMATKSNGTLWMWGSNSYGQLGLGDVVDHAQPTQVGTDVDWLASKPINRLGSGYASSYKSFIIK